MNEYIKFKDDSNAIILLKSIKTIYISDLDNYEITIMIEDTEYIIKYFNYNYLEKDYLRLCKILNIENAKIITDSDEKQDGELSLCQK